MRNRRKWSICRFLTPILTSTLKSLQKRKRELELARVEPCPQCCWADKTNHRTSNSLGRPVPGSLSLPWVGIPLRRVEPGPEVEAYLLEQLKHPESRRPRRNRSLITTDDGTKVVQEKVFRRQIQLSGDWTVFCSAYADARTSYAIIKSEGVSAWWHHASFSGSLEEANVFGDLGNDDSSGVGDV